MGGHVRKPVAVGRSMQWMQCMPMKFRLFSHFFFVFQSVISFLLINILNFFSIFQFLNSLFSHQNRFCGVVVLHEMQWFSCIQNYILHSLVYPLCGPTQPFWDAREKRRWKSTDLIAFNTTALPSGCPHRSPPSRLDPQRDGNWNSKWKLWELGDGFLYNILRSPHVFILEPYQRKKK